MESGFAISATRRQELSICAQIHVHNFNSPATEECAWEVHEPVALKIKLCFHWYRVPTFTVPSRDTGGTRIMSKKFGLVICRRRKVRLTLSEGARRTLRVAKTGDVGEATFRSMVKVCA